MSENYIVINGKKAELTQEQLKALGIEPQKTSAFSRAERGMTYYMLRSDNVVQSCYESDDVMDRSRHVVANYCTDKDLLQQQAYREALNRLLWRFSMEHRGDEIDWNNKQIQKWKIKFHNDHLTVEWNIDDRVIGCVYFHTRKIAEQAIEEIVKPFMKAHPDFTL